MPKSALIIDDSRIALTALSRLVEKYHLTVDTAESVREANEYLRLNAPPDVIFMGHILPGQEGFEALAAMKKSWLTAAIPIVMYTAKNDPAYLDQARRFGATDVLPKPTHPTQLERILKRLNLVIAEDEREIQVGAVHVQHDVRVMNASAGMLQRPSAARALSSDQRVPGRRSTDRERGLLNEAKKRAITRPDVTSVDQVSEVVEHHALENHLNLWLRLLVFVSLLMPAVWFYFEYREAEALKLQALAENQQLKAQLRANALLFDQQPADSADDL